MAQRHPNVVNVDEVQAEEQGEGGFHNREKQLGDAAHGVGLGCSHYEIAPGKTAFPYHFHSAFEEAVFVLEGSASMRIGEDLVELRKGDYVALPPGPKFAHAVTNNGTQPLRLLTLGGAAYRPNLDVCVYPDSKKVFFAAGNGEWTKKMVKLDSPEPGYFEGEPLARK